MSYIRHAEKLATIELFVERAPPGAKPLEVPRFFLRAVAGGRLVMDSGWLDTLNDPAATDFFDKIIEETPELLETEEG
jgi:hypothetical protein